MANVTSTGNHENPVLPVRTLTPEILVPRLGDYLVERGILSPQALKDALNKQNQLTTPNQPPPLLGNILVDLGYIDRATLDQIITEQILQLRSALQAANQSLERRVQERTAELEMALKKVSELSQLKSNFIANISHELRTPLTHIIGYIELLISRDLGPLTDDQEQATFIMKRSSERLKRLIEDLILFSNTEGGQVHLEIETFSINLLFEELRRQVQTKRRDTSMDIEINCPENLQPVRADQEKILWVLLQLVDNAIKFNKPGGKITIAAENDGSFVRLSVADTGIGIAPDKLEEIFEPFHQLDGSSTRKAGGTGLGLNLARKIVEAHGSILSVYSEPGEGSRFEFTIISSRPFSNHYPVD
ncbi:MAG: hypothetical protein GYA48_11300 [Chloroflexi bacterium]|nr:hypothetical protein [Chloroflexota bacterium]